MMMHCYLLFLSPCVCVCVLVCACVCECIMSYTIILSRGRMLCLGLGQNISRFQMWMEKSHVRIIRIIISAEYPTQELSVFQQISHARIISHFCRMSHARIISHFCRMSHLIY